MGGDFNFMSDGADRVNMRRVGRVVGPDRSAAAFHDHFRDYVELRQTAYTRKKVVFGQLVELSRLDRWYFRGAEVEPFDRRIET